MSKGNFIATLVLALAYVEPVINDALPALLLNAWAPNMAAANTPSNRHGWPAYSPTTFWTERNGERLSQSIHASPG